MNAPVTSPEKIKDGDVIWLGDIRLVVILVEPPPANTTQEPPSAKGATILHNVKELQQHWIQANADRDDISNKDKTIARLKDLVEIAKSLSAAESIEAIFFRYRRSFSVTSRVLID
jgi:adenylate cyclase